MGAACPEQRFREDMDRNRIEHCLCCISAACRKRPAAGRADVQLRIEIDLAEVTRRRRVPRARLAPMYPHAIC